MAEIHLTQVLPRSPEIVWEYLRHIERHVEWMADAESIQFESAATEGVGVCFVCVTRVGPIRLRDRMEVTGWVPGEVLGIRHRGIVTGEGVFRLKPVKGPSGEDHTEMEWSEKLDFGWRMGGPVVAAVAAPILKAIWKRNLKRLAQRLA